MRISRSIMAVGGVVLAGAIIGFTNPKTVHALAAALVQVTNTASNPVVTQSVGAQAANLVRLVCPTSDGSTEVTCLVLEPNSQRGGNFSVPSGQTLIVTGVDAMVFNGFPSCPGPYVLSLVRPSGDIAFLTVGVSNTPVTTQFRYSPGLAIGQGALSAQGPARSSTSCNTGTTLFVYGYLTPA